MGNCCFDRRHAKSEQVDSRDQNTATNDTNELAHSLNADSVHENNQKPENSQAAERPQSYEMRIVQATGSFQKLLKGFERDEELSEGSQIHTHMWLGTIDTASAQFALRATLALQAEDFTTDPIIRFAYYSALKQGNTLKTVVENLHAVKRCVRYSFARLLEVMLHVFVNLTLSLVHDLIAVNILPSLSRALLANETCEYHLCISNTLHCLYCRNIFVQNALLDPTHQPLLLSFLTLLTRFSDPRMVRIHAENVSDFVMRHNGALLTENWKKVEMLGLVQMVNESREKLANSTSKQYDEIKKADLALRKLLSDGLKCLPEAASSPVS